MARRIGGGIITLIGLAMLGTIALAYQGTNPFGTTTMDDYITVATSFSIIWKV